MFRFDDRRYDELMLLYLPLAVGRIVDAFDLRAEPLLQILLSRNACAVALVDSRLPTI